MVVHEFACLFGNTSVHVRFGKQQPEDLRHTPFFPRPTFFVRKEKKKRATRQEINSKSVFL
jgi:hypothetical protein